MKVNQTIVATKSNFTRGLLSVSNVGFVALALITVQQVTSGAGVPEMEPATANFTWSIVPSPRRPTASYLSGVSALSPSLAWAAGYGLANEGTPLIYQWNGARWKMAVAAPIVDGYLKDVVAIAPDDVWAVGNHDGTCDEQLTVTEHWDGTSWTRVPSPNGQPCNGLQYLNGVAAAASNDVWAVGYQTTNQNYSELLLHWDGTAWTQVRPLPGAYRVLNDVVALATNDVWAVGYQFTFSAGDQPLVMHWNGSQWSNVPTPLAADDYSFLYGVAAVSSSDIWAVGYGAVPPKAVTMHWDGSAWSFIPNPIIRANQVYLENVTALSSNDVWAAGYYLSGGFPANYHNLIEHWRGGGWTEVEVPDVPRGTNQLYGLAPDRAGGVWAVGEFYPNDLSKPISTLVLRGAP